MKRAFLACAVVIGVVATLLAQVPTPVAEKPAAEKPPAQQVGGLRFVDQAEVSVVNVEVAVRDKKDAVVLGLKASDFEIYQDGKFQAITNFAPYTRVVEPGIGLAKPTPAPGSAPAETPTPEAPAPKRDPRFMAIYVDSENILPQNRNRVIGQTVEFITKSLKEPDQVMVVSYQRSLKVLQTFTSDAEDVASALRKTKKYTGGRSELVSSRRRIEEYMSQNARQPETIVQAMDQVESFAKEQRNNLTFSVRAIQELITMMSGLPGKRSILYVSDGLPMSPGLELYYQAQDVYNSPIALSRAREWDSRDLFASLAMTASAGGVTLYTVDARGLEMESGIEAENRQARSPITATVALTNYQDSLSFMAERTGGLALLNSNDVTKGLERIAEDVETYYSLGYRLVPSGQDRMHYIEVKLKGRPGCKVKYKPTFIEKTLATKVGDRVISALAFDLDDNPLKIELEAGTPAPSSADRWTLPVSIKVPVNKVALIPDGEDLIGYLMCYYAARDDEGQESDLQRVEHTIRIPAKDYDEQKLQQVTITAELLLDAGRYRISVGVRDELTNQAGYALIRKPVHPETK